MNAFFYPLIPSFLPLSLPSFLSPSLPSFLSHSFLFNFDHFILHYSVLTEHWGGRWPFWLSPRQAIIVPIDMKVTNRKQCFSLISSPLSLATLTLSISLLSSLFLNSSTILSSLPSSLSLPSHFLSSFTLITPILLFYFINSISSNLLFSPCLPLVR